MSHYREEVAREGKFVVFIEQDFMAQRPVDTSGLQLNITDDNFKHANPEGCNAYPDWAMDWDEGNWLEERNEIEEYVDDPVEKATALQQLREHYEADRDSTWSCFPVRFYNTRGGTELCLLNMGEDQNAHGYILVQDKRDDLQKLADARRDTPYPSPYEMAQSYAQEWTYWLQGDVWIYFIIEYDDEGEEIDIVESCAGFYDYCYAIKEAEQALRQYVDMVAVTT